MSQVQVRCILGLMLCATTVRSWAAPGGGVLASSLRRLGPRRGVSTFRTAALSLGAGNLRGGAAATTCSATQTQEFIDQVNSGYEVVHKAFEAQFWGTKMVLSDGVKLADGTPVSKFNTDELTRTKTEMEAFLADKSKLDRARELLKSEGLTDEQKKVLGMFERTFKCYIMESDEAKKLREESMKIEGSLEAARNTMKLGADLPGQGFTELSSVGLRNKMRTDNDEAVRKAAYNGLRTIGPFVLENGFVEVVKARNKMAKSLGYVDYYDYKVTQAEGFGKDELFKILDTLEQGTRNLMVSARARLAKEKGEAALDAWNMGYMMAGDITQKLDPYFPFEKAVEMWGRSFNALKIGYRGATMDLDLLDRKGKYSNGFCHWPQPAWTKPDGTWQPSLAHFTSLADPAAIGSGHTALTTLMHEAGHAAHFANIEQPSPLFAQERAPTSVAYAELQSMFLDSLVGDAAWRGRYARDRDGKPVPWELVESDLRSNHPYKVFALRAMIAVPYFEKALYELPEAEVTAERITALADEIETKIQGGLSARPLLSVPHLLADEASCYYHGYVLAEMAVQQTRAFFLKKFGRIVDNAEVGPMLTSAYWKAGNSEMFLDLVKNLTGAPLTGDAWVKELEEDLEEVIKHERTEYDWAVSKPHPAEESTADVDLGMRVRFVNGDVVIADTAATNGFLPACKEFEKYVTANFKRG